MKISSKWQISLIHRDNYVINVTDTTRTNVENPDNVLAI